MGWLSNKDSKNIQDYTKGNKGGKPPKQDSKAAKLAKIAADKAAKAAKNKVKDMRMATPDNRCAGAGCKRPAARGAVLCKSCQGNPDQHNFVSLDED